MSILNPSAPNSLRIDFDLVEKAALAVLFSFFAARMLGSFLNTGAYTSLIFLINEAVILGFVLFRHKAKTISLRPFDWAIASGGTLLPLLAVPASGTPILPIELCAAIMMMGFGVHLLAKLSLRRSFGIVAANRGVKQSGLYRIVRHPMYLGYCITQLGVLLAGPNLINVTVITLAWAFQIMRIASEERILKEDPSYRELMRTTPYRILPGVY